MPTNLSSLEALMEAADDAGSDGLRDIAVALIEPDPEQPRTHFPEIRLRELAASIQAQGVVQPLVVRPLDGERYALIAGERRWRAAQMAGLDSVPVVVRDLDPQNVIAVQLVENLDREDLSIIDQALGVVRLLEQTQAKAGEVAKLLGKSASWVSQRRKIGKKHDLASPFVDAGATTDPETLAMLIDLHRLDEGSYTRFFSYRSVPRDLVRDALNVAKGKNKTERPVDAGAHGTKQLPVEEVGASADPASSAVSVLDPGSGDPGEAVTSAPIKQDEEGDTVGFAKEHPAPARRSSSPKVETSELANQHEGISSAKLREAQEDLRRSLQQPVTVTSDEGGGAVVRIHCDSVERLFILVERLLFGVPR